MQNRVHEDSVLLRVKHLRGLFRIRVVGPDRVGVERKPELGRWNQAAQTLDGKAVAEKQVMGRRRGERVIGMTGGVNSRGDSPRCATTCGSFRVIQFAQSSPIASAMIWARSAKRSAVSRLAQPPASSSACGRSQ